MTKYVLLIVISLVSTGCTKEYMQSLEREVNRRSAMQKQAWQECAKIGGVPVLDDMSFGRYYYTVMKDCRLPCAEKLPVAPVESK